MAIDVLRALRKGEDIAEALAAELAAARGTNAAFDRFAATLAQRIADGSDEADGRRLAQDVALAVQAALLHQHAPDFVFDAFCRSRLAGDWGQAFGTLPSNVDFDALINRAKPTEMEPPRRFAPAPQGGAVPLGTARREG
jgi:putative acyl-CoA dehydrogenase